MNSSPQATDRMTRYSGDAGAASPQPVDLGTPVVTYSPVASSGHAMPTRPGSPAAVAVTPAKATEDVAPVTTYTVGKGGAYSFTFTKVGQWGFHNHDRIDKKGTVVVEAQ